MPIHSSSARPILRIGAALAMAAAVAFAAAPPHALGGPAGPAGDPPGSSTCRICHSEARFGNTFSHRGLEESADGCATCHGDGSAHVDARGGKGSISSPRRGSADAEFELCLTCHDEGDYRTPKHLGLPPAPVKPAAERPAATAPAATAPAATAPAATAKETPAAKPDAPKAPAAKPAPPKVVRCTDCHTLHGGALPVRTPTAPGLDIAPKAPVGPAKGSPWARGTVETGWRFVGDEEGRYDQDVNLDGGPRLLAVDARAGLDDLDSLSPRLEILATGLGDPTAYGRVRAKSGDRWTVLVEGRRVEGNFPGQNGLHGGESLRETLAASVDLKLDRTFRAAAGWDQVDTERDIAGTLFDNGSQVPVSGNADVRHGEGWASLSGGGRGWHAALRQGWVSETGKDGKTRDFSAPGAPDRYLYDDDSRMTGPRTTVVVGASSKDGRLSVEARGNRTDFDRDVDLLEHRRSVVSSTTVDRLAVTEGTKDLLLLDGSVHAGFAFNDRWTLEGSLYRRSQREDGRTETATTVDSGLGPVTTTALRDDSLSHVLMEERLSLLHTLEGGFRVRGGVEHASEDLNDRDDDPRDISVRTRGFFGGAEGKITPDLTFRGGFHTAAASGQFTPMDPEDRGTWRAAAAWRDAEGWRAGADWNYTRYEARDSGLDASGNQLRVYAGMGKDDGFTTDLSYTVRKQSTEVDTRSWVSSTLVSGKASSEIRSHLVGGRVGIPLAPRLRLIASATWLEDRGSLPLRTFDGSVGVRWEISKTLAARIEVRRRIYDETGESRLDYTADILQVSLEARF